ncbi:hypothetical protein ACVBGC_17125 [Burkholderia stagnalis]
MFDPLFRQFDDDPAGPCGGMAAIRPATRDAGPGATIPPRLHSTQALP